jgi:hypothetical protein
MRFWRDENEQTPLRLVAEPSSNNDARGGFEMEQPRRLEVVAMRATQHCCFYCQWCAAIISLPHDQLSMMFAGPAIRRINARSLATVCRSCHHVATYSLFRGANGFDTRHKLAAIHPAGTTVLAGWLQCEEPTCAYPLPLFVASETELTGEMVKNLARNWEWKGLTCASAHPIHPPRWLLGEEPLNLPAQLKQAI